MINIIVLKFKSDRRQITKIFVKIIRAERKSFFKINLRSLRALIKRINQNFLNILSEFEKCSTNHQTDLESSRALIKRIEVYLSSKKTSNIKSFIFQCFRAEKQIRAATFHLLHKFSRIFDILRRIKSVSEVKMQIMYKRKTQKTNSVDVNIFDESKLETNSKWRKILKSFVTVDSLKQLKKLYDSFLISKFSKISRSSRMISKRLQKMLFDAKLSF